MIDYHNHLDSVSPATALQVMDAAGVERIVNITMQVGDAAFEIADGFRRASQDRFPTIGWMDWSGLERPDFVQVTIERLKRMLDCGFCGDQVLERFRIDAQGRGRTVAAHQPRALRVDL